MKIERRGLEVYIFVRRRRDRFFPGTLFQDWHRRPQAVCEPEKLLISKKDYVRFILVKKLST